METVLDTDRAIDPVQGPFQYASARRLDAQRRRSQAHELYQKSKAVWEEAVRSGERFCQAQLSEAGKVRIEVRIEG